MKDCMKRNTENEKKQRGKRNMKEISKKENRKMRQRKTSEREKRLSDGLHERQEERN